MEKKLYEVVYIEYEVSEYNADGSPWQYIILDEGLTLNDAANIILDNIILHKEKIVEIKVYTTENPFIW